MKVNRNYRFVLTVLDNDQIAAGEVRIDNEEITGERMFAIITPRKISLRQ